MAGKVALKIRNCVLAETSIGPGEGSPWSMESLREVHPLIGSLMLEDSSCEDIIPNNQNTSHC
jgi:hypothetical protein